MSGNTHSSSCACGCCQGVEPLAPRSPENPPGLSELAYRVGTHGAFKESMQAALARQAALASLTSRSDEDPTHALLDSSSVVLDILAFYQERIANEGFLRTATQRRSLLELANALGYQLNPGVAASTYFAFEMDTTPGAPESVRIDAGTKVQSQPKQDETPQLFETLDTITARPEWNAMGARQWQDQTWHSGKTSIYLSGTGLGLEPGDTIVIQRAPLDTANAWFTTLLAAVEEDFDNDRSAITLSEALPSVYNNSMQSGYPKVFAFRQKAAAFGHNAPDWRILPEASKKDYLGKGEDEDLTDEEKVEWPDFHIHLPTDEGVAVAATETQTYVSYPTSRSIAKAVNDSMEAFSRTESAALQSQTATTGFAAAQTAMQSFGIVGASIANLTNALKAGAAEVHEDSPIAW